MEENKLKIQQIDIATYEGMIPVGTDLVIFESGDFSSAIILHGFDEIGIFDSKFKAPAYGFMNDL